MTRGAFLISLICLGVVSLACRPDLEPNTRCLYSEADFGWLAASITPTINDPDRCPDDVPSGGVAKAWAINFRTSASIPRADLISTRIFASDGVLLVGGPRIDFFQLDASGKYVADQFGVYVAGLIDQSDDEFNQDIVQSNSTATDGTYGLAFAYLPYFYTTNTAIKITAGAVPSVSVGDTVKIRGWSRENIPQSSPWAYPSGQWYLGNTAIPTTTTLKYTLGLGSPTVFEYKADKKVTSTGTKTWKLVITYPPYGMQTTKTWSSTVVP